MSAAPDFKQAAEFISNVATSYVNGETDKIILIHNGYVNMITQEIKEDHVLPVDTSSLELNSVSTSELEIEPDDDDTLLDALVRRYIEYTMYYSLIDSLAVGIIRKLAHLITQPCVPLLPDELPLSPVGN